MRRMIAALAVAGLMLAGAASPALAKKPSSTAKAERMCERNNGTFIDLSSLAYACVLPTGATEREIKQAARECKKRGGALFVGVGNVAYACVLPGGESILDDGGVPLPVDGISGGLRLLPVVLV